MSNLIPGLTRSQVEAYYKRPDVQLELLNQFGSRPVSVVQSELNGEKIFKRKREGKYIKIPGVHDLEHYTTRRHTEFHPTTGKTTEQFIVDLDPGPVATLDKVKAATRAVVDALNNRFPGKSEVAFSGGHGFHVRHPIGKPMRTSRARATLLGALRDIEGTTFRKPTGNDVRLDMVAMKPMGSVRAVGSLNAETGLRSMKVDLKDIGSFEPGMAKVGFFGTYYHGTSPQKEKKILQEGLDPRKGGTGAIRIRGQTSPFAGALAEAFSDRPAAMRKATKGYTFVTPSKTVARLYGLMHDPEIQRLQKQLMTGKTRQEAAQTARNLLRQYPKSFLNYQPLKMRGPFKGLIKDVDSPLAYKTKTPIPASGIAKARPSILGRIARSILTKRAQFAPGLPSKKVTTPIRPQDIGDPFTFAIQKHKTDRSGGKKHYDLRLVDEESGVAHSWAIPKARLPGRMGEKLLAKQQPDHTADYAKGFQGKIPEGYGAGTVKTKPPKPMDILKADLSSIVFQVMNGSKKVYNLRRMGTDPTDWFIQKLDARRHARARVKPSGLAASGVEGPKPPKPPKIAVPRPTPIE